MANFGEGLGGFLQGLSGGVAKGMEMRRLDEIADRQKLLDKTQTLGEIMKLPAGKLREAAINETLGGLGVSEEHRKIYLKANEEEFQMVQDATMEFLKQNPDAGEAQVRAFFQTATPAQQMQMWQNLAKQKRQREGQELLKSFLPQTGAPQTQPTAAAEGGEIPAAAPGSVSAPSAQTGQFQYVPRFTFDKEGDISVSFDPKTQQNFRETLLGPEGPQIYHFVVDPMSGQIAKQIPIGKPVGGESLQRASSAVQGLGIPQGHPRHGEYVGRYLAAQSYTGDAQNVAIDQLKKEIGLEMRGAGQSRQTKPQAQTGATPAQPATGGIPGAPSAEKSIVQQSVELGAQRAGAETAARETAQRHYGQLSAETQRRLTAFDTIEANLQVVQRTYRPQYVGKGFQVFGTELQNYIKEQEKAERHGEGKYAQQPPGAIIGRFQEFLGQAPPEQVEFYRGLLDMADQILRARSGAQINEQEYLRLTRILPGMFNEPQTFEARFNSFANIVRTERESIARNALRSPSELLKDIKSQPKAQIGGQKAQPSKRLIGRTKQGKAVYELPDGTRKVME